MACNFHQNPNASSINRLIWSGYAIFVCTCAVNTRVLTIIERVLQPLIAIMYNEYLIVAIVRPHSKCISSSAIHLGMFHPSENTFNPSKIRAQVTCCRQHPERPSLCLTSHLAFMYLTFDHAFAVITFQLHSRQCTSKSVPVAGDPHHCYHTHPHTQAAKELT
jgi:hypothetical protein